MEVAVGWVMRVVARAIFCECLSPLKSSGKHLAKQGTARFSTYTLPRISFSAFDFLLGFFLN